MAAIWTLTDLWITSVITSVITLFTVRILQQCLALSLLRATQGLFCGDEDQTVQIYTFPLKYYKFSPLNSFEMETILVFGDFPVSIMLNVHVFDTKIKIRTCIL